MDAPRPCVPEATPSASLRLPRSRVYRRRDTSKSPDVSARGLAGSGAVLRTLVAPIVDRHQENAVDVQGLRRKLITAVVVVPASTMTRARCDPDAHATVAGLVARDGVALRSCAYEPVAADHADEGRDRKGSPSRAGGAAVGIALLALASYGGLVIATRPVSSSAWCARSDGHRHSRARNERHARRQPRGVAHARADQPGLA